MKRTLHFFSWDHVAHCLVLVTIIAIVGVASVNLSFFSPMKRALEDFSMTDAYYEIQRNGGMEMDTTIVLVDMTKLRARGDIARTVADIQRCNPRVLVVDLIFEREGEDPMGNAELVDALMQRPDNEVLSMKLTDYNPQKACFTHSVKSFFHEFTPPISWGYGNVIQIHTGGCVRKYSIGQSLDGTPVYSLAYVAACLYRGRKPHREEPNERIIVYGNTDFPVVQCDEVARFAPLLRDKIVILGTESTEEDSHISPVGKMAGMRIQAYSIKSYLYHDNIVQMSRLASVLLALVLCYVSAWMGYLIYKLPQPTALYVVKLYYFALAALLAWVSFICFVKFDYNVNLLYPLLGIALVEEARLHYKWMISMLQTHTRWKWPRRSIYQSKPGAGKVTAKEKV